MAKKRKDKRELKKIARQMSTPEQQDASGSIEPLTKKESRKGKKPSGALASAVKVDTPAPTPASPVSDSPPVQPIEELVPAASAFSPNVQQDVTEALTEDMSFRGSATEVSDAINDLGVEGINQDIIDTTKENSEKESAIITALKAPRELEEEERLNNGSTVMENITKQSIDQVSDELFADEWEGSDPEMRRKAEISLAVMKRRREAQGEPAIEKLGLQDYFPNAGHRVAVGSYSRKTLGSGNIYAGAGFVAPMGIVDARRRALAKQARAKATDKTRAMESLYAQGAIQYQPKIDKMSLELTEKYGQLTGYDWDVLSDRTTPIGREFWKETVKMQTFAKQTLNLNKVAEKIQKMRVGKDAQFTDVPKDVSDALDKWMDGGHNMEDMYNNPKAYMKAAEKFKAYDSMTHAVEEAQAGITPADYDKMYLKNIDMSDPEQAKTVREALTRIRNGNSDEVYLAYQTFLKPERIDALMNGIMKSNTFGDHITEEDTRKYLMSFFGARMNLNKYNTATGRLTDSRIKGFRKEDEEKAQFWKTVTKKTEEHKTDIQDIARMYPDDPVKRKNAIIAALAEKGVIATVDEYGIIKMDVGAAKGAKSTQRLSDMMFGVGMTAVSYESYKNAIKVSVETDAEIAALSPEDRYIFESSGNETFDTDVTNGQTGYSHVVDGRVVPLSIYDTAEAWEDADVQNSFVVGAEVEFEVDDTYEGTNNKRKGYAFITGEGGKLATKYFGTEAAAQEYAYSTFDGKIESLTEEEKKALWAKAGYGGVLVMKKKIKANISGRRSWNGYDEHNQAVADATYNKESDVVTEYNDAADQAAGGRLTERKGYVSSSTPPDGETPEVLDIEDQF